MLSALQAFVGAHYADVIPHEAPKFVPVVGNYHLFIGVLYPRLIPIWDWVWLIDARRDSIDRLCC